MKQYKALVKFNGEAKVITSEYNTKAEFVKELRANGYQVNDKKVKEAELFDWIIENTNCTDADWSIRSIKGAKAVGTDDWFESQFKKFGL